MADRDGSYHLANLDEMDDSYFGGSGRALRGRGTEGKVPVGKSDFLEEDFVEVSKWNVLSGLRNGGYSGEYISKKLIELYKLPGVRFNEDKVLTIAMKDMKHIDLIMANKILESANNIIEFPDVPTRLIVIRTSNQKIVKMVIENYYASSVRQTESSSKY